MIGVVLTKFDAKRASLGNAHAYSYAYYGYGDADRQAAH
jgi:hypothetical protein